MKRLILLSMAAVFLSHTAFATTVRILGLDEMVRISERVFLGKCLKAEELVDSRSGHSVREYHFLVTDAIKGVENGETVVFRQIRSVGQGAIPLPGIPHYRKGQEILLFLHGDSKLGLTSPVGMSQGTLYREKMENGESGFMNPLRNQNFAQMAVETQVMQQSGMSAQEASRLSSGRPIPLREIKSMVQKLELYYQAQGNPIR